MADWATISAFVEGHANSGLSLAAYARQAGMSPWRAYDWRNRWRRRQEADAGTGDSGALVSAGRIDVGAGSSAVESTSRRVADHAAADIARMKDSAPALTGAGLFRQVVPTGDSTTTAHQMDAEQTPGSLLIEVGSDCRLVVSDGSGVALAALFVRQVQAEVG